MDATKLKKTAVEETQGYLGDLQTAVNDAEEACYGVLDADDADDLKDAHDVLAEALDEIDRTHLQLRSFLSRQLGDDDAE